MSSAYRDTRPEVTPPMIRSTSAAVTALKSPQTECFRQEAATAKLRAFWRSSP